MEAYWLLFKNYITWYLLSETYYFKFLRIDDAIQKRDKGFTVFQSWPLFCTGWDFQNGSIMTRSAASAKQNGRNWNLLGSTDITLLNWLSQICI